MNECMNELIYINESMNKCCLGQEEVLLKLNELQLWLYKKAGKCR